jgi:hypothetical protein
VRGVRADARVQVGSGFIPAPPLCRLIPRPVLRERVGVREIYAHCKSRSCDASPHLASPVEYHGRGIGLVLLRLLGARLISVNRRLSSQLELRLQPVTSFSVTELIAQGLGYRVTPFSRD